jgi:hypothetical protein
MPTKPTKVAAPPPGPSVSDAHSVKKKHRKVHTAVSGTRQRTSMTRQQRQARKHAEEKALAKERAQALLARVKQEKEAENRARLKRALELKHQSTDRAAAAFLADPSMSQVLTALALGDTCVTGGGVSENSLTPLELQQLRGIFTAQDEDQDGLISDNQVRDALVALGYAPTDAVVETFRPRVRSRSSAAAPSSTAKQAATNSGTATSNHTAMSSAGDNPSDVGVKPVHVGAPTPDSLVAGALGSKHKLLTPPPSRQGSKLHLVGSRNSRGRSSSSNNTSHQKGGGGKQPNKRIPFSIDLTGFLGAAGALDNSLDCIDDILPAFEFLRGNGGGVEDVDTVSQGELVRLLRGVQNTTTLSDSEVNGFLAAAAKSMPAFMPGNTSQRVDTVNLLENLMFV